MEGIIEFKHTEKVLREYGEKVAEAYRQKMRGHGHFTMTPDTLIDNVQVEVVNEYGGGISVALSLNKYWKYVEWDTKPHFPPKGALLQWIQAKPILPHPDSNGRIPTPEQLDFLIRRKIAEEGTTGTHDLADAVQEMNEQYTSKIEDAVAQDIDEFTTAQITLLFGAGSR